MHKNDRDHGHRHTDNRNGTTSLLRFGTGIRRLVFALALCLLLQPTAESATAPEYDRTQLLVKLAPTVGAPRQIALGKSGRTDFDQAITAIGVQELRQTFRPLSITHPNARLADDMGLSGYVTMTIPKGIDPDEFKSRIESLSSVESAEFDIIVRIASPTITPNDPYFATHQYSLRNTGTQPPADHGTPGADLEMQAAWEHTTGDSSVILAIVDTGIDFEHPDLAGRLWFNWDEGSDGVDEDSNGFASDWRGWNFNGNNNNPDDDHSHGTHCAGIAGAAANNGIGNVGMDWKCKLMAVKVLGANGSGSASSVAAGITYAADNGADVISLSLGSFAASSVEEDAINYATALGVVVVAAMGNDNVSTPHYPSAFPNAIAIGATDSDDFRAHPFCGAPGSNYGDYIDVCAPGDWVWSLVPLENGSYSYKCGTSMATPHVAGLVALIKSLRPTYTLTEVRPLLRAAAEDQVGRASEDTPGFDPYHGYGRINGRITLQALTIAFPPILDLPGPQTVTEMDTLEFVVTASDSNFTSLALSADAFPNASFVDSGNGTGVFSLIPDMSQAGVYSVAFIADDGGLADTGYVSVTIVDGCECPFQGDFDNNAIVDAVDLGAIIDIVFFSASDPLDPNCPLTRGDLTCDGFTTAEDLAVIVDFVFFSGPAACDPCLP